MCIPLVEWFISSCVHILYCQVSPFLFSPYRQCKMSIRKVADSSITVAGLENALHAGLRKYTSNDLDETLKIFGDQVVWNNGPKANLLALAAPLLAPIVNLCKNGVVPSKKFETALLGRNAQSKMNLSKESNNEFCNTRGTPRDSHAHIFIT